MSDVATALLQPTGRPEPTADPALAAVKLARATIDALILRLDQTIDAKVTAQLAGGLTQLAAGSESFVLKLETPLPVSTAVTLKIATAPNGQPAVTVTVQPQPTTAQPALPAPSPSPPQLVASLPPQARSPVPPGPLPTTVPAPLPNNVPAAALTVPQSTSGQAIPMPVTTPQAVPPAALPAPAAQPAANPAPASPPVTATVLPAAQPAAVAAPVTSTPIAVLAATPPVFAGSPTVVPQSATITPAMPPAPAASATPFQPGTATSPVNGTMPTASQQPVASAPAAPAPLPFPAPAPAFATAVSTLPVPPQPAAAPTTPPPLALPAAPTPATPRPATPPASPPLTQILADPVQAAARQDNVLPLIARLATLNAPAIAALPRPALEAIARILASRLDLNRAAPDGKVIRDAVLRAGVITESGSRTPADAKSALLQLRSVLSGFLGGEVEAIVPVTRRPPPPLKGEPVRAPSPQQAGPSLEEPADTARQLLGHADAALSRLKLLQLASNPADVVRPNAPAPAAEFRVEVPMQLGAETGILQLLVERDGKHKRTPAERGWRMRFALNFTATGEVGAEISLLGRSANVALWAAEPATADALEAMLPELAPALASHGLDVGSVRVRRGAPQPVARAPGQLLDSAR